MKKSKLAKLIDDLIYCTLLIIICILICGILKCNIYLQLTLGILFGVILFMVLFNLLSHSSKSKELQKSEQDYMEDIFTTLKYTNPDRVLNFLEKAFSDSGNCIVSHKNSFFVINHKKTNCSFGVFFNFLSETSTEQLFVFLNQKTAPKHKIVLGIEFSPECYQIEKSEPNLTLLDKVECFNLFKLLNCFPEVNKTIIKRNRLNELKQTFSRINIKKFLTISIVLWLISFFTTLRLYYRIASTISLILGLIPLFIPKQPTKDNNKLKDLFNDFEKV